MNLLPAAAKLFRVVQVAKVAVLGVGFMVAGTVFLIHDDLRDSPNSISWKDLLRFASMELCGVTVIGLAWLRWKRGRSKSAVGQATNS